MTRQLFPSSLLVLAVLGCAAQEVDTAPTVERTVMDLTKVAVKDTKKDYLLGPTGARGWMHTESVRLTPQDYTPDMSTAFARQILVTDVEEGSPAATVLAVGDVILGIGDVPFDSNPRHALADAINEAEKSEGDGVLRLLRWRPDGSDTEGAASRGPGQQEVVTLKLKVLGTYSDSAPYGCAKSEALLKQTIGAVYRDEINGKLGLWALGLLATGERQHIERVKQYIATVAKPDLKLGVDAVEKGSAWGWGYQLILLSEYHLMTGDESVMHAIRELAIALSLGQSNIGTWGHHMASPSYNDGRLHGRLAGYATLNQPSITCYMALVLARKCGIEHPEVARALGKCNEFYVYYIGKGAIPYGYDHPKDYMLTNNGTSGTAALTFAIDGNRDGAKFFARLCGGAAHAVETGHTGAFFNSMWTGLGANVGGSEMYGAYFRDWTWRRTMTRKWNGGYLYQQAGGGRHSYRGLGASSAMLLHLCVGRRKLYITGRGQDESAWFAPAEAERIAGYSRIDYKEKRVDELLQLLADDAPFVRRYAADELAKRSGEFVVDLKNMLRGSRNQKIGACRALTNMKEAAAPAIDDLLLIIRDRDEELWVRSRALDALSRVGEDARVHLPELLLMLVGDLPEDQRRRFELNIAWAVTNLSEKPYAEKMDKKLVYAAARKLLTHPHMRGRMEGMKLIESIGLDDFRMFADQIVHVVRNQDPSYHTYHYDRPAKMGLDILERLNIREAMDLAIETIYQGIWGQKYRIGGRRGRLKFIERFGASAREFIPKLRSMNLGASGDQTIKAIEESTTVRELISIEEAKRWTAP